MPTVLNLTREQINRYRITAQKKHEQEKAYTEIRRKQAWQAAKQAAQILKKQFGATRVVVFGSLIQEAGFTRWSDVDIAAWGISPKDTFQAIGTISELDTDVPVNLVDVNTARSSLLNTITQNGIEL